MVRVINGFPVHLNLVVLRTARPKLAGNSTLCSGIICSLTMKFLHAVSSYYISCACTILRCWMASHANFLEVVVPSVGTSRPRKRRNDKWYRQGTLCKRTKVLDFFLLGYSYIVYVGNLYLIVECSKLSHTKMRRTSTTPEIFRYPLHLGLHPRVTTHNTSHLRRGSAT